MSVSSSDPKTTIASASTYAPSHKIASFALIAFFTLCAAAFSLSPAVLMVVGQIVANSAGGPVWP